MVARIYINNVQVGFIPLNQYEQIKKSAYKNKKNYILQFFYIIKISVKLIAKTILLMPYFWLSILIICLLFDIQSVTSFASFLKESSPEEITNLIQYMVWTGFFGSFVSVFSISILKFKKLNNAFHQSIEKSVLELLEVPERGDVFIQVEK